MIKHLLFPILIFFSSCSSKKEEINLPPDEILSEQQLKSVLVELFLTEATLGDLYLPDDTLRTGMHDIYDSLFIKHQTSAESFVTSLNYYSTENGRILPIMEKVLDSLNALGNTPLSSADDEFSN